jgi:hypothetical protein
LLSFRSASQIITANLQSPNTVANSARRRIWDGGLRPSLVIEVRPGREATEDVTWTGVGDGDGEPNKRRVEENKREGSLRVEEN